MRTPSALTQTVRRVLERLGFEVEFEPVAHPYLSARADLIATLRGQGRIVVQTKDLQSGMQVTPDMLQQLEYMVRLHKRTVEEPVKGLLVTTGTPNRGALHYMENYARDIRLASGDEADVADRVRELAEGFAAPVSPKV